MAKKVIGGTTYYVSIKGTAQPGHSLIVLRTVFMPLRTAHLSLVWPEGSRGFILSVSRAKRLSKALQQFIKEQS